MSLKRSALGFLLLLLPSVLSAQSFDDIDKLLEAQFNEIEVSLEKKFSQVDRAILRAFEGTTTRIEKTWQNDVVLPGKSVWVHYSKDLQSRTIINYEEGEILVEVITNKGQSPERTLERAQAQLAETISMDANEMENSDILSKEISDQLSKLVQDANEIDENQEQRLSPAETDENLAHTSNTAFNSTDDDVNTLADVVDLQTQTISQVDLNNIPNSLLSRTEVNNRDESKVSKLQVKVNFINDFQKILLERHLDDIKYFSEQYNIAVSILLAIIETESSFNPRATSSVPAFGLMQLVPRTAGIDAYDLVYGEKKIVTPEYLYREKNNLELGTAYFYLVSNHYLKGIEDELSRFYCAIASYNTGIGNVTRTFGHNTIKGSVEKINTLTPEQVLQFLMLHLPATETKNYLKKILARKSRYEKYDKA